MNHAMIPKTLCVVYKDGARILKGDEINKEIVGAKAYGLSTIPSAWTLPFFVISSEMYEMYVTDQNIESLEQVWCSQINEAMHIMHFDFSQNIFLRSNMCTEDLAARGQFESYDCSVNELFVTIKVFFDDIKNLQVKITKAPILLQQYSQVIGRGHISNERRVSKEHRDWKGEIEQKIWNGTFIALDNVFTVSVRNWRRKIIVRETNVFPLLCSSLKNITQVLELPCAWATNQAIRIHFEWVFDGKFIYIVQADIEHENGINPMALADSSYHSIKLDFTPQILHILSSEDKEKYSRFSKIINPLIYNELGLKTTPIYILDNHNEIQNLLNENISEQLSDDLNVLVSNPLVIRTDVDTNDQSLKQMLPRTDDIRNKNDAIDWLIEKSKKLCERFNGNFPFIFILHNFIPAFSSAFAYAEPNNRKVLIESLWGVPEGLYYYTHDKYIVDTKQQDFSNAILSEVCVVQKRINPKTNFIFPKPDGKWSYNPVSTDYIWKPAISKESWVKDIAMNTRKISEHVGSSISVMWFVGVNSKIYGCNVFPWHHEQYTYNAVFKQTNRKKHRNELRYMISKNYDIDRLQQIVKSGNPENIKYLFLKPTEESMIRNKDLIEEVGKIAKELNAVVTLEGGVLSHAYYQLKQTGAAVEVINVFDSTILNIEHDKLVRDKIPEKIARGGEIAITNNLADNELFEQLRIKLVEEAFEVLEAENANDLIQELADVLEVLDSIIKKQKINKKSVIIAKNRKREKIGGFQNGVILRKTALPVLKSTGNVERISSKKEKLPTYWTDKKEKTNYNETIKRLKIPISLKQWSTQLSAKSLYKRPNIHIVLRGKRINSSLQIEISISEDYKQLLLFDDL